MTRNTLAVTTLAHDQTMRLERPCVPNVHTEPRQPTGADVKGGLRTPTPQSAGGCPPLAGGDSHEFGDKALSASENAPDDGGCLGQTIVGSVAVSVRQPGPQATAGCAHSSEAVAFDHEHGRLYEALERAAQLAELAGDDDIASDLRILRRRVARHIENRWCGP